MPDPDDPVIWAEAFQINFVAARRLGECLIPAMATRGWGRVINVTGAIISKTINAGQGGAGKLVQGDGRHLRRVWCHGELRGTGPPQLQADLGAAAPDRGIPA